MAHFHKVGDVWRAHIDITINGERFRESKRFMRKSAAVIWAEEREAEIRSGIYTRFDDSKTFADAIKRYLKEITPTRRSKKSESLRLNYFLRSEHLNTKIKLVNLSEEYFEDYRKGRLSEVMTSTINKEISLMRSVIRAARTWRWIKHDPFKHLEYLKEPPPRNRRISPREIEIVLEALDYDEDLPPTNNKQRVAIMFLFALETAMRLGEICNLDWNNINLQQQYLTIPRSKNGDARDIPLSSRAVELLRKMKDYSKNLIHEKSGQDEYGRKYSYRALPVFYKDYARGSDRASALFAKYVRKTEIRDLRFHDTRHEACTRLAQKIDVLDLAKMIGHRDLNSLMIYYNPTATEIAKRLG